VNNLEFFSGNNIGLTTYMRAGNEIAFTQEAALITAHGKNSLVQHLCQNVVNESAIVQIFNF